MGAGVNSRQTPGMREAITIRKCDKTDVAAIIELGIETFRDTFGPVNTAENMDRYLTSTFTVERITQEFDEKSTVFFLAQENGKPLGYAKVRAAEEAGVAGNRPLEIERLYARANVIGKGIGKALMEACLAHGRSNGYDVVWLGVWEHNHRALQFYKKWGFEKFSQHVFMLGLDVQTDLLFQKKIN
jgi:diamine N-acetyltransferase